jgi:hypothetical protein
VKSLASLILIISLSGVLYAQKPMFPEPLSPRIANYKISVTLDTETRKLHGREVLTWRNHSDDYINDLQFHLYLNAFKNELSTFMKESGGHHHGKSMEKAGGWGWIEITRMVLNDTDLMDNFEYIQPDDDNAHDQTVLRVTLEQPIKPKEEISIIIDFTAQLTEVFARTGYKGDFYMVGQWFPKIGVYEAAGERYSTEGQWNCHQFHSNSEFFADYGVYEVTITLPQKYIVGATGVLIDEKNNDDNTKSLTYYCEDVHDFAWTADPDYIVIEDQWRHVNIKFLAHPGRDSQIARHIGAAKNALEFFDERCGTYPYPTLTIVDPRYRALGAGGMEYPTLITSGSFWLLPQGIRLPELVVVHEFAHNYWYGIVGSNEFEEAWLDEGLTTYFEFKIVDRYYGESEGSMISLFGLNIDDWEMSWGTYASRPTLDTIYKYSWEYQRGGYGILSYYKAALMLLTLENHLGEEKIQEVIRAYYERYKFWHPTSRDFINTVNEITGMDFNWYFDQVLYGTGVLDYKIDRISSKRLFQDEEGVFGNPLQIEETQGDSSDSSRNDLSEVDSTRKDQKLYESKVIVAREGEVIFPVDILVRFDNGDELREKWDGKERFVVYKYESESQVVSAEVDPEKQILLDINFLNNGKTVKTNRAAIYKYSVRWFFWMQNFLHLITIFG